MDKAYYNIGSRYNYTRFNVIFDSFDIAVDQLEQQQPPSFADAVKALEQQTPASFADAVKALETET